MWCKRDRLENDRMKRNALLFVISNFINKFGDSIDFIALTWLAYQITGSTTLTGIVAVFNGLPSLILGTFAGILSDKHNKKQVIIINDIGRAIIILILLILFKLHCLNIYILILATIGISTLEILAAPARRSLLPFIVEKDMLSKVNSKNTACKTLSQVLGLAIAGVIIDRYGVTVAMNIDILSFIISVCLIKGIEIINKTVKKQSRSLREDFKNGFRAFKDNVVVLETTIIATLVNIFIGGFNVLILSYCVNILKNNSRGQSMINTLNIIGILLISTYLSTTKKKKDDSNIIKVGFYGLGICMIMFGICNNKISGYIVALLYGIFTGCITTTSITIIQENTPLEHLGKVMAIISVINESSVPIGNFFTATLLMFLNEQTVLKIFGIMILGCVFVTRVVFKSNATNTAINIGVRDDSNN